MHNATAIVLCTKATTTQSIKIWENWFFVAVTSRRDHEMQARESRMNEWCFQHCFSFFFVVFFFVLSYFFFNRYFLSLHSAAAPHIQYLTEIPANARLVDRSVGRLRLYLQLVRLPTEIGYFYFIGYFIFLAHISCVSFRALLFYFYLFYGDCAYLEYIPLSRHCACAVLCQNYSTKSNIRTIPFSFSFLFRFILLLFI